MCLLVLGGDPAAWRVSGGHGSIPQCPGEACRELNGSDNARSSCPFVKDKSFKSHRPIRRASNLTRSITKKTLMFESLISQRKDVSAYHGTAIALIVTNLDATHAFPPYHCGVEVSLILCARGDSPPHTHTPTHPHTTRFSLNAAGTACRTPGVVSQTRSGFSNNRPRGSLLAGRERPS